MESDRHQPTDKNEVVHDWPIIDDPADPRLVDYIGLTDRDIVRRHETEQFFIAEGPEVVRRLVASGLPIRSIVLAPNRVDDMTATLIDVTAPIFIAERAVISAVAGFDLHRGVIASAARPPLVSLDEVLSRPTPHGRPHRLAVLEGLNDHENLGAIARSARAFEIDALVLDPTCADPYYRRTIRVSMGEILFLPIVRSTIADVLAAVRRHGGSSLALTPDRSAPSLTDIQLPSDGPLALVFGSEGFGLDATTLDACDSRARIPIAHDVDSLNVGHAAAVAFAFTHRPA